jgi:hypothetical protein
LEHKKVKKWYKCASKSSHTASVTRINQHEEHIHEIEANVSGTTMELSDNDQLPCTDPNLHHYISDGQKHLVDIGDFLLEYQDDPALKVYLYSNFHWLYTDILHRTFLYVYRIIYWPDSWARNMMVMKLNSQIPSRAQSISTNTGYISMKFLE